MEGSIFEMVVEVLERQVSNPTRNTTVESETQLLPCFDVWDGVRLKIKVPKSSFVFEGVLKWLCPLELLRFVPQVGCHLADCYDI